MLKVTTLSGRSLKNQETSLSFRRMGTASIIISEELHMPRHLRFQAQRWTPHLVTARCIQGFALLRPSPKLNTLVAGVLAYSLSKHSDEIQLHSYVFMGNHFHLILSADTSHSKARFMCHLMSNLARELGRVWGWKQHIWEGRYASHALLDEEALISAYQYIFKNSVKEGLVAHPRDWPGLHAWGQLCEGKAVFGEWLDRTRWYFAQKTQRGAQLTERDFTETLTLQLTRPPIWSEWTEAFYVFKCREWARVALDEVSEQRVAVRLERAVGDEAGRVVFDVLGAQGVCEQEVFEPRLSPRRPRPLCRAGCPVRFREHYERYWAFKEAFQAAHLRLRRAVISGVGWVRVVVPEGGVPVMVGGGKT